MRPFAQPALLHVRAARRPRRLLVVRAEANWLCREGFHVRRPRLRATESDQARRRPARPSRGGVRANNADECGRFSRGEGARSADTDRGPVVGNGAGGYQQLLRDVPRDLILLWDPEVAVLHTTRTTRTHPCARTHAQRTRATPLRACARALTHACTPLAHARALTHLPVVEGADRKHIDRRTVAKIGIDVPARARARERKSVCARVCAHARSAPICVCMDSRCAGADGSARREDGVVHDRNVDVACVRRRAARARRAAL